ncbi:MAG TPA: hypothetical protein PLN05_07490 [Pyrinomonadaceae bacterium]|nr:hypothetical protein [Chloracidobacterium sp.]HBE83000.1 hypothetical protein [Blastocatellia bacterium]HRJ87797.1 hypothetical protein [Pyrinomonadaceae bacterium]HRK50253.1 hypothetical protein [Pyrinomonadaceae bacterium]
MKRSILTIVIALSLSSNLIAKWALISTAELVKDSDLILVGTLQNVSEFTRDNVDYSEGFIVVEKVIAGNDKTTSGDILKSGDKIFIKWQNSSMIACPRVEHKGDENVKGIWLLEVESDGTVSSDYPWRFSELDELDKLSKVVRETKLRRSLTRLAVVDEMLTNSNEERPSTTENELGEVPVEVRSTPPSSEYSLFDAGLVLVLCTFLYYLLYRSRFRIR